MNHPASCSQQPEQNHLLGCLSADVQERLFPYLEPVSLPLGKSIYGPGDTLQYVHFPVDCIVSLLNMTENGESLEISVVGNEGIVGISVFLGGDSTHDHAIVQIPGTGYRLPSQRLKDELNRHDELFYLMLSYTQSLVTQITLTSACNRHHSIDQQLCRWLLICLDRLKGPELQVSQKLIANMLGLPQEGVTEVAGKLQQLGAIEYRHDRIRILDRPKLEKLSCECYQVVKSETDKLRATTTGNH